MPGLARCAAMFFAALVTFAPAAHAGKRMALVIGVDAYQEVQPLKKSVANAKAVGAALERSGFSVTTLFDGTRREAHPQDRRFQNALAAGDTALIHFSGHGLEIDGQQYLLPADVPSPRRLGREHLKYEAISLSSLIARIDSTGASTRILIVDACGNASSVDAGTPGSCVRERARAPEGTFILYSAAEGQVALDRLRETETEPTSVFTRVLLRHITAEDREIVEVAKEVQREVTALARTVDREQTPQYVDRLIEPFFLKPSGSVSERPATVEAFPWTGEGMLIENSVR